MLHEKKKTIDRRMQPDKRKNAQTLIQPTFTLFRTTIFITICTLAIFFLPRPLIGDSSLQICSIAYFLSSALVKQQKIKTKTEKSFALNLH